MNASVAEIWRHPIKSHGRESVEHVALSVGKSMPWDRAWAVAHELSTFDENKWAPCSQFSRAARAASLQAISANFDDQSMQITLTHPDRPAITFCPDDNPDAFIEWVTGLVPADQHRPVRMVRARAQAMTDTSFPSISLVNIASNGEVENKLGISLSMNRWRGNICMQGLAPWQEFDWLDKEIRIGSCSLLVCEKIIRCKATTVDPATGVADADTLGGLQSGWGHKNFGVYARVIKSGEIHKGDKIRVSK